MALAQGCFPLLELGLDLAFAAHELLRGWRQVTAATLTLDPCAHIMCI